MADERYTERQLEILLRDYDIARADDRNNVNVTAALIGVAATFLAGLAALLSGTCQFRRDVQPCLPLDDRVLAALPVLPLGVLGYAAIVSTINTVRSFYMRSLEAELRLHFTRDFLSAPDLRPASATELTLAVASGRRGRWTVKFFGILLIACAVLAFGGLAVTIADNLGGSWPLVMALVYIPLALVFVIEFLIVNASGRSLFTEAVQRMRGSPYPVDRFVVARPPGRSFVSYLLLPRPEDLVKALFVGAAYVLGLGIVGTLGRVDAGTFLLAWAAFEYLAYEARYQVNDVRGLATDIAHPDREARARLPLGALGLHATVAVSLLIALARVLLLAVLLLVVDGLWAVLGYPVVFLAVTTAVYEFLRSDTALERLPAPALAWSIWLVVGSGYAARAAVGLLAAGLSGVSPVFLVLLGAAWTFGIMFVTLTWTLEASAQLYEARGKQEDDGGTWHYRASGSDRAGLVDRPHLKTLLRWTELAPTEAGPDLVLGRRGDVLTPLSGAIPILAPGSLSLVAGLVLGVLGASASIASTATLLVLGLGAASLAVVLAFLRTSLLRWGTLVASALLLAAVASVVAGFVTAAVVFFVVGVVGGLHCFFRDQSYEDLKRGPQPAIDAVSAGGVKLLGLLVGRRTAGLLGLSGDRRNALDAE